MNGISAHTLAAEIAKGSFKPNMYLTNISTAYFQSIERYVAKAIFPICPVQLSSARYYEFDKASLLRDNMSRKPQFGKVSPAQMGQLDKPYNCEVYQVITGIDQLDTLNYQRSKAPGAANPKNAKVRYIIEQAHLHQDLLFAENFFKPGVWSNEWSGSTTYSEASKTSIKFSDDNCDPVRLFDDFCTQIEQSTGRRPNRLGLGKETFNALKNHPAVVERVKFGGSTPNPATVNERVLAELFGLERVVTLASIYNSAGLGEKEDMKFICDPKAAILAYATNNPMIDEPSAGYIFTWDMLGDGQLMPIIQYEGENGTHSEFIEGLLAVDMKKTADDLAILLKDCV